MGDRLESPPIRKLTYGLDPNKSNWSIAVGGTVRNNTKNYYVSEIIESREMFLEYGYFEYYIFASPDGTKKNQFFWKRYLARPDAIEYFFPDENQQEFYIDP